MTSKRRTAKPAAGSPVEPAREGGGVVAVPSMFDRVIARIKTLKGAIVAIAGVGAVLGGLAGYWNAYQAARGSTESSKLLALVGKGNAGPLSIVVLPFANLTGDPQQAYLADGLTAAITSDLSRIRDAFIVSTATAFAYKDKPVTVQQIGKELGVRFALQGGVQRSGDKIRINAQLADTTTNAQLWSESFDGSQGNLFALQELVTARIGNSIGREMVRIAAGEAETRTGDPKVADLMLRASALIVQPLSKAKFERLQALYRQALHTEPNNVRAMAGLAISLWGEARQIPDPVIRERQLMEAGELALRAKELDPKVANVYVTVSDYAAYRGDFEGAKRASETGLSLQPKEPIWYSNVADDYLNFGEPERAIELLSQAIRLDPRQVRDYILRNMGRAHFMKGDDESAIDWLLKALDANPGVTRMRAYLAMSYARKGDRKRAQTEVATLLTQDPTFDLFKLEWRRIERFPPAYREYWETNLLPAWRLAGLPE